MIPDTLMTNACNLCVALRGLHAEKVRAATV